MDTRTDHHNECCPDQHCDSGRRNRYYPGKRMPPDAHEVEQTYQQQRRRLLNRAIHGWGVVYGFELRTADANKCSDDGERRLRIRPGLALDKCGRELLQVESAALDYADLLLFDKNGKYFERPEGKRREGEQRAPWGDEGEKFNFLLRAHYAERLISPVAQRDPCQCEHQEWDHVCETVRYSLTPIDDCCKPHDCELECDCSRGHCCPEGDVKPAGRGGCRCLCEHLMHLDPSPDCCSLSVLGKVLKVDLHHGVPLACLRLMRDNCGDWTIRDIVDACGPRRLVKRNDLLFDLIRGCDLTHISEVGWAPWHRLQQAIKFDDFSASFGEPQAGEPEVSITRDYWIRFSKPIQVATIRRDCFTMTAILREFEGGWGQLLRVPLGVRWEDPGNTGYTQLVRLFVDAGWLRDALRGNSMFEQNMSRIEITVRGDYLLDCNGQAVDANARGMSAAPTGNGVPGDTYVSTFLVQKKPARYPGTESTHTG